MSGRHHCPLLSAAYPREIAHVHSSPLLAAGFTIDGAQSGLDVAAALAKAEGAALHILAFDCLEGLATAGLVNEQALEQMRLGYVERHQWLEDQARRCATSSMVTTEVAWGGTPAAGDITMEEPMAAVIKALEHESLLSRLMFTPLDVHLARECPVPLHFAQAVRNMPARAQDRGRRGPVPSQ